MKCFAIWVISQLTKRKPAACSLSENHTLFKIVFYVLQRYERFRMAKHMQICVMWVYSLLYDAASWTFFKKNPSWYIPKPSGWGGCKCWQEGCAIDWNNTIDVDVDVDGYYIVALAASFVGLFFELNSSDCIRILKSTFWISCFARMRCFWFKFFNSVTISSPVSSTDANLLMTWSALNSSASILDF